MDLSKATQRLLKAIENPFTTMLGHPTGRLLLQRQGYPVDHKIIIDACAKHELIIEINANPCISPDAGFVAAVERAGPGF